MALWYETGNGMVQTSFARKTNSCAALLCCGGPSLSSVNPNYLNGHNRIVFALNNTYPFIKPDVWIGMDDPSCYHRDIFWQPFVKIMRGGYQNRRCEGENISHLHNMFYADVEKVDDQEEVFTRRAHASRFVWHGNSLATALHLIVWMGCKEIYLFGCDLDNSGKDYFDDRTLGKAHRKRNQNLHDELFLYLKWFFEVGKLHHGVSLYSCSSSSRINSFLPFVDHHDLIKAREKDLIYGKKLLHANEVAGALVGFTPE